VDAHPAGDHTLFIGHVEFLEWTDAKPLLFFWRKISSPENGIRQI